MTIRRTTLIQGPPGPPGLGGTYVSVGFTVPAVNATVSVTLANAQFLVVGSKVWIATAGFYSVLSVTDQTHAVLTNLGYVGNASPSSTVTAPQPLLPMS